MSDDYQSDCRTERVQCSGMWFVVHRTTDHTQRAACYLCGWWSKGQLTHTSTVIELDEHLATLEHRVAVREFIAGQSTLAEDALGAPSTQHTCPHCLTTTFDPQGKQQHYCRVCHHFCGDIVSEPAAAPEQARRPSPQPARAGIEPASPEQVRWPW